MEQQRTPVLVFQNNPPPEQDRMEGEAFVHDGGDAVHVIHNDPEYRSTGARHKALIIRVPAVEKATDPIEYLQPEDKQPQPTGIVVFWERDDGAAGQVKRVRSFRYNHDNKTYVRLQTSLFHQPDQQYARLKGQVNLSKLSNARVVVVGLGSGGSYIAVEMAKAGVGHFLLVDFDRLELVNIVRHQCGTESIGRYKTKAVAEKIKHHNPSATVTTLEQDIMDIHGDDLDKLLEEFKPSLMIVATDSNPSRRLLNAKTIKFKIPALYGFVYKKAAAGEVFIYRPNRGPCYSCTYTAGYLNDANLPSFPELPKELDAVIQTTEDIKTLLRNLSSANYNREDPDDTLNFQAGLSTDITPVPNMMVKLALLELSPQENQALPKILQSSQFVWVNRY